MKRFRLFLALLLATAGPVFMFWLMHHGINYQDEPYMMLNAAEYAHTPLAPLSTWMGHLWSMVFGYNLLNLRILSAIYISLSMALPCILLYRRTRCADISLALFGIGCAWLALVPSKSFLWGWDSLSTLMLVNASCLCISYLHRPTISKAVLLGLCMALAVMARVPNVAGVGVVLAVLIHSAPQGQKLRFPLTFLMPFCAAIIICLLVIYGSISGYIDAMSENMISGHGVDYLLAGYARTAMALVLFSCYVGAILMIAVMLPTWFAAGVVTLALALVSQLPEFPFFATPCYLSLGLLTVGLIYMRRNIALVLCLAAMALCATAGSDLGLEKTITLQFIPLLISEAMPNSRRPLIMTTAATFAITLWASIPVQAEASFEDCGFGHTTELVTDTPYAGIYTTPERKSEIQQLDSIISSWELSGGEVLVIGDCYHFGAQLLSRAPRPAPIRHVYLIDYTTYVPTVDSLLQAADRHNQLVIATRPFDWRYPESATDRFPSLSSRPAISTLQFDVFYPMNSGI